MDDGTTVLLAASTESLHNVIAKALKLDFAVGGLLLATLACLTLFSVRRRMRPLEDMVETSSAIAEGDLTRRVPSSSEATLEVEQLRLALNSMLQQVETAYRTRERSAAQLRRFVGDASHELRTPLSAIRGYLQLHDKGMLTDPDERRRAWDRMNNEVDRMGHLVDELLTLARLDQRPELRLRDVDLSRLVRDAAADLRAQQPDRPVTVRAEDTVLVRADESGLRQVLGNLVSNVRAHTAGGRAGTAGGGARGRSRTPLRGGRGPGPGRGGRGQDLRPLLQGRRRRGQRLGHGDRARSGRDPRR